MSVNPFNDQLWAQVCQAFDDGWGYGVQEKFNHKGKRAEGLRRAIAALDAAGYAVVPVKPTMGMYLAAGNLWDYDKSRFEQFKEEYAAMLTAAKETP